MSESDPQEYRQRAAERHHQFYLTDNELLCKNRCGFYGTPQCKGLCSQCWRNYQLENKRLSDYNKNRELLRQETVELLRKTSDVRHTFQTLLKKSPSVFTQEALLSPTITIANQSATRPLSPESNLVLTDFQKYLSHTFPPTIAKEFENNCQTFVDNLIKDELVPIEELSNSVQLFYQSMKDHILKIHPLPENSTISQFMTELETFICVRAYHILFGSRSEDEIEDLSLQSRIRSLNWVTNGFLETTLDEASSLVQEHMNEAITEIIDLNSHRSVVKKMDCLVRCSKNIFEAVKESQYGAPASADEFMPVLILIVLKANPPLIQSNLKFISCFGLASRHMRGEYGYYYTCIWSAIYFIQDMKGNHLQINEDEFEAYTSGKLVPSSVRNTISTYVMRSIGNSLKRLDGLLQTQNKLVIDLDKIDAKIESGSSELKHCIKEFMDEEYPEEVKIIMAMNTETEATKENHSKF